MNKIYNNDNEVRTPSGKDFNPTMAKSINRRYVFSIKDKQLTASTEYTINGRRYKVNSIFDLLKVTLLPLRFITNMKLYSFRIFTDIYNIFNFCSIVIKQNCPKNKLRIHSLFFFQFSGFSMIF